MYTTPEFWIILLPLTIIILSIGNSIEKKYGVILNSRLLAFVSALMIFYQDYYTAIMFCVLTLINLLFIMINPKKKIKKLATIAIVLNILVLLWFKYLKTIVAKHWEIGLSDTRIPIGISYFSLMQICMISFCFLEQVKDEHIEKSSIISYSFFFPTIVSGPIIFFEEFRDELCRYSKRFNSIKRWRGLLSISLGMAKKVLIASRLNELVEYCYSSIHSLSIAEKIVCMFAFSLYIYFDFSGYSDMAEGVSELLGIEIVSNFDSPYKASSIEEFWKKWHISLTRFLTRFVYIPLGGNRISKTRTIVNIFIVFLISGVWHGIQPGFFIWAFGHALWMIIDKNIKKTRRIIPRFLSVLTTYIFVSILWIPFWLGDMDSIKSFFTFSGSNALGVSTAFMEAMQFKWIAWIANILGASDIVRRGVSFGMTMLLFVISYFIIFFCKNTRQIKTKDNIGKLQMIVFGGMFWLSLIDLTGVSTFIYEGF